MKIQSQRKKTGRPGTQQGDGTPSCKRLAKLFRYCRIMHMKHRNAQPWMAGQGVMRHGRRIKAGFVKHRNTISIIRTES